MSIESAITDQREEWMRQIQAQLSEQGTEAATVVTMGECPHTGKVLHEVIENND